MTAKKITIEGSITPSVELPRGERRTVQHTDEVQALIDGGFVVVVPDPEDERPAHEQEQDTKPRGGGKAADKADDNG